MKQRKTKMVSAEIPVEANDKLEKFLRRSKTTKYAYLLSALESKLVADGQAKIASCLRRKGQRTIGQNRAQSGAENAGGK